MRLSTLSCLITALLSSPPVIADNLAAEVTQTISERPLTTDAPELVNGPKLELRAVVENLGATQAPTQVPAITTLYLQSKVGSTVTYVEVVYTQTFASVPDQYPSPASGAIGYGTLVKQNNKREAVPTAGDVQGSATSFVLEYQTVVKTIHLTPMTRVVEVTTVTGGPDESVPTGSAENDASNITTCSQIVSPSQMNSKFARSTITFDLGMDL